MDEKQLLREILLRLDALDERVTMLQSDLRQLHNLMGSPLNRGGSPYDASRPRGHGRPLDRGDEPVQVLGAHFFFTAFASALPASAAASRIQPSTSAKASAPTSKVKM